MRTIKKILTICIALLMLVSCSSTKTLEFYGESKNWKGSYSALTNANKNDEQGTYEFRFQGSNMEANIIEELIIENKSNTTRLTDFSLQSGLIKVPASCSGCSLSNKDTPIKITIKWDKYEETFDLY